MRGPDEPFYKTRVSVHRGWKDLRTGEFIPNGGPGPVHSSVVAAEFELPLGAADKRGRAYWFVYPGFIRFDPKAVAWDQPQAPVQHLLTAAPTMDWIDGTGPAWSDRRQGASATGPDGRLYLAGGFGVTGDGGAEATVIGGLDIYDPEANSWKHAASMKHARQSLAVAFAKNGKLYVFGGCGCRGSVPLYKANDLESRRSADAEADAQRQAVRETEVYDPKTGTWSTAAPMPTPRMLFAAATGADGKIYLIGGQTSWGGPPLSLVEIYDPPTNSWSKGPSLRIGRVGHAAVATGDGTIWVLGGYAAGAGFGDEGGPTDSVELLTTSPPK